MDMDLLTNTTKLEWYPAKDAGDPTDSVTCRKKNKILVEKRRRERINSCLETMKSLVLQSMQKDAAEYSKMEKADILEMTVKYLQDVQRFHVKKGTANYPSKYQAGFTECAAEVSRYLSQAPYLSTDVKLRLMDHLAGCVQPSSAPVRPQPPSMVHGNTLHDVSQLGGVSGIPKPAPYHSFMIPVIPINMPTATHTSSLPGAPHNSAPPSNVSGYDVLPRTMSPPSDSRGYDALPRTRSPPSDSRGYDSLPLTRSPPSANSGYDALHRTRSPPSNTPSPLIVAPTKTSSRSPLPNEAFPPAGSTSSHSTSTSPTSSFSDTDSGHFSPGSGYNKTSPYSGLSHTVREHPNKHLHEHHKDNSSALRAFQEHHKDNSSAPQAFHAYVPGDQLCREVKQRHVVDHLDSKQSDDPMWRPW